MPHFRLHFPPFNSLGAEKNPYKFGNSRDARSLRPLQMAPLRPNSTASPTPDARAVRPYRHRMHLPALCLFTTPDPLAHKTPDVSPYLYCAGNPIMFIDPTGKILKYIEDGKESYTYTIEDDCIVAINNNGEKIDVKNLSSQEQKLLGTLNELFSYKTGNKALANVIESSETINIKLGKENNFNPETQTINYNINSTTCGLSYNFVSGEFSRTAPAFIALGHEMFHASDFVTGNFDTNTWVIAGANDIANAEISACNQENTLREEAGWPLRISYAPMKYTSPITGEKFYMPHNETMLYFRRWNKYISRTHNFLPRYD